MFISKLNAAGSTLLYSTFFGGNGEEEATSVAADSGAIYATGIVAASGMTTKNYLDNIFNGPTDAFLMKINPSVAGSNGLLYSTYLGGSSDDEAKGLALGASGKVYLTGDTNKTGVGAYSYTAAHPHAVTVAGPFGFGYDAENRPTCMINNGVPKRYQQITEANCTD